MQSRIRGFCRVLSGALFAGAVVINGAVQAQATSEQPSSEAPSLARPNKPATPMNEQTNAAPYSVRFRITGFLAKQHAREGSHWRSLVEFYSMLNVDDHAWTDDERGDSFRITRDIDVAQMMTEVGFYDHAIRILHTSMILAVVNGDPQVVQIDFQIQATSDLAKLKGIPVPEVDMSFLTNYEPVRPASALEQVPTAPSTAPATDVQPAFADEGPALGGTPVADLPTAPADTPTAPGQPNELPPMRSESVPIQNESVGSSRIESKVVEKDPEERSGWNWLSLSRWRQKRDIAPATSVSVQEDVTPQRPTTAPAVAPTYCQGCNGLHGAGGNVVVRYNPRTGVTHTHLPGSPTVSPMPSPYQKQFAPLQAEGQHRVAAPTANSSRRGIATDSSYASSSADQTGNLPTTQRANLAEARSHADSKPESTEHVKQTLDVASFKAVDEKPASNPPAPIESSNRPEQKQEPSVASRPARTLAQVGVAGEVSNPGIFAMQGRSTTLAALLRRTGERELTSDKKARILRAVEMRDEDSGESIKDFYCQRLDAVRLNTESMETPVYSHEVVIVDGKGEKPIYLAVMPHFILQVPVDHRSTVTTQQIIEQLSAHWPNIRNQSIGVLRYEQWGSAANVSRLTEGDPAAHVALTGGDVVYVDGTLLDRSEVIAAAESIAKMTGARIRKHQ